MLRVGLTGGIACGKSHVLARLAERGFSTIDLDRVAHDVVEPRGEAHEEVVAAFGRQILGHDGRVDRRALGRIVFGDPAARDRLNAIVHPRVRQAEARWAAAEEARGSRVAVTDAALLVESGLHLRFDRLVVVHCPAEEQLRRLRARDGIDEAAARARIDAQMPIAEKRGFGHVEIDSSGPLAETDAATRDASAHLEETATSIGPPEAVPFERAVAALAAGPRVGPRGLRPTPLLAAVASWGGLDLSRAARLLVPAATAPWYRQARAEEAEPAHALAAVLLLWALTRDRMDDEFLASAAASLARLTHLEGSGVADAVAVALALRRALADGRAPAAGWARVALAGRWGHASASEGLEDRVATWLAAAAHGASRDAAPPEAATAVRQVRSLSGARRLP